MKNKKLVIIMIAFLLAIVTWILISSISWLIQEHNKAKTIAIYTQDTLRAELIAKIEEPKMKINWELEKLNQELEKIVNKLNFLKENKDKLNNCMKANENNIWTVEEVIKCDYALPEDYELENITKEKLHIKQAEAIEPPKTENKKLWERFNWSYEIDWWLVNSDWNSQARFTLEWDNPNNRSINLLNKYWFYKEDANLWLEAEDRWWIMRWVMICISKADSSLWKALKTKNNFGNVGNNDRWDRVHFSSKEDWINAIWRVLHNTYLAHKQSIWSLSVWWWGSAPYYATSRQNWNNNILNCLRVIYQDTKIDENFSFRK